MLPKMGKVLLPMHYKLVVKKSKTEKQTYDLSLAHYLKSDRNATFLDQKMLFSDKFSEL
jgi:hypothetical protein